MVASAGAAKIHKTQNKVASGLLSPGGGVPLASRSSTLITNRNRNKWYELSKQNLRNFPCREQIMPDGTKRASLSLAADGNATAEVRDLNLSSGKPLQQLLSEPVSKMEQERRIMASKKTKMILQDGTREQRQRKQKKIKKNINSIDQIQNQQQVMLDQMEYSQLQMMQ